MLIDTIFAENPTESSENEDELCYVDSVKQEARDDKITFDNDYEIFNNVNGLHLV